MSRRLLNGEVDKIRKTDFYNPIDKFYRLFTYNDDMYKVVKMNNNKFMLCEILCGSYANARTKSISLNAILQSGKSYYNYYNSTQILDDDLSFWYEFDDWNDFIMFLIKNIKTKYKFCISIN